MQAMPPFKGRKSSISQLSNADKQDDRSTVLSVMKNASERLTGGLKISASEDNIDEKVENTAKVTYSTVVSNSFVLATEERGYNSGRKYYFQTSTDQQRKQIIAALTPKYKAARKSQQARSRLIRIKRKLVRILNSDPFQYFFASLIIAVRSRHYFEPSHRPSKLRNEDYCLTGLCEPAPAAWQNFAANVVQMQLVSGLTNDDGSLNGTGRLLDTLDTFFTIIFAVELALNMFAHWFRDFWNEGWNWFVREFRSPFP